MNSNLMIEKSKTREDGRFSVTFTFGSLRPEQYEAIVITLFDTMESVGLKIGEPKQLSTGPGSELQQ